MSVTQFKRTLTFDDWDSQGNPLQSGATYLQEQLEPDLSGDELYPGFQEGFTHESAPDGYDHFTEDPNALIWLDDGSSSLLSQGRPLRKTFR